MVAKLWPITTGEDPFALGDDDDDSFTVRARSHLTTTTDWN